MIILKYVLNVGSLIDVLRLSSTSKCWRMFSDGDSSQANESFETMIITAVKIQFGVCSSSRVHAHKNKIKPVTHFNVS